MDKKQKQKTKQRNKGAKKQRRKEGLAFDDTVG